MASRVLILSWEYPPVIEGGLARHVRKLAEELVAQGTVVDVLTRGETNRPRANTSTASPFIVSASPAFRRI